MSGTFPPTSTTANRAKPSLDLEQLRGRFSWPDYTVFALLLAVSACIGIYYGVVKRKHNRSTSDFLMAGRSMSTFPMAMSLIASFMSAITLLGTPAEIYQYGTMYWFIGVSYFLVIPAAAYLYLPVFYQLELTSAYEYLELRFNKTLRCTGSGIFIVQMVLYMAIVVYAPALALSQVTGIGVYLSVCLIFGVCGFYTVLGGMKAVMWTDTVQVIIMYGAMIGVVIQGALDVGGIGTVLSINRASGRLDLNLSGDIRERHTLWSTVFGGYFTWIAIYGVNQAQVQRYLTVPKMQQAVHALWINLVGLFFLLSLCSFAGMVIYAKYEFCDPLTTHVVDKSDQLFPLFVMDTLGHLPGVPGIFVAGIFSGALSTVSSGVNSLAAITLEDFVRPFWLKNMNEKQELRMSKFLSLGYALLSFGLVFVAEQLGDVLQAALSIFGMVGGPLLGLFTLGMFFPWANAKGAVTGALGALTITFWLGFGAQVAKAKGFLAVEKMPTSAECLFTNATMDLSTLAPSTVAPTAEPDTFPLLDLYGVSYMWYAVIGCFSVIIIGMAVSFATGLQDTSKVDPRLICPVLRKVIESVVPEPLRETIRWRVGEDATPNLGDKMFHLGAVDSVASIQDYAQQNGAYTNEVFVGSHEDPEKELDAKKPPSATSAPK